MTELDERERDFFIDDLLARIHFIIVLIRWTGLAPWEFELMIKWIRSSRLSIQKSLSDGPKQPDTEPDDPLASPEEISRGRVLSDS